MTRVKICGVSDPADARRVAELGAWALGMIFWPQSARVCSLDNAELIGAELHGDEGPAYCREVARRTGAKVMKAVRVRDAAQVHDLQRFHTDLHMLDTYSPRTPGGTGETFDWELARLHPRTPPVVLSGGLDPDNVGAAIETARPFAVDVATGTEAAPGRKDPAKLTAFVRAVEQADARLGALA